MKQLAKLQTTAKAVIRGKFRHLNATLQEKRQTNFMSNLRTKVEVKK